MTDPDSPTSTGAGRLDVEALVVPRPAAGAGEAGLGSHGREANSRGGRVGRAAARYGFGMTTDAQGGPGTAMSPVLETGAPF